MATTNSQFKARMGQRLKEELNAYAEYHHEDVDVIVMELLRKALGGDKEWQAHRSEGSNENGTRGRKAKVEA